MVIFQRTENYRLSSAKRFLAFSSPQNIGKLVSKAFTVVPCVKTVPSSWEKGLAVPDKFRGKHNTHTIGQYCPKGRAGYVGTAEARHKRDEAKALIAQGIDPNKHKQAQHYRSDEISDTSFEAIAREWHSKGTWVDQYAKRILSSLERDVFPVIGYKQIDKVSSQDIIQILRTVEERKAYDVAKRICQRCEAVFDYGLIKGLCENNPASGRAKFVKTLKTFLIPSSL